MGYLVEIKNKAKVEELLNKENPAQWMHDIYLRPNAWISSEYAEYDDVLDMYDEDEIEEAGWMWIEADSKVEALRKAIS